MLENILKAGFQDLGICPDGQAIGRYRAYCDALEEKNRVMNLTAISGEADIARLHFLDCAALLKYENFKGKQVIDVGTGAGFPGLALKIAEPDMHLTLLDSLDKRIGFLRRCCEELGLNDTVCIHARAEEMPRGFRENYDIAVSRAVARLSVLSELCLPYVKKGGVFMAMKGPDYEQELEEAKPGIKKLGGKTEVCRSYTIPGTDICHSAIIIRKIEESPASFPRRWAQIKKSPL